MRFLYNRRIMDRSRSSKFCACNVHSPWVISVLFGMKSMQMYYEKSAYFLHHPTVASSVSQSWKCWLYWQICVSKGGSVNKLVSLVWCSSRCDTLFTCEFLVFQLGGRACDVGCQFIITSRLPFPGSDHLGMSVLCGTCRYPQLGNFVNMIRFK